MSRCRFVEDHQADYPVTRLCKLAGVSRSGFYARRCRPSKRAPRRIYERHYLRVADQLMHDAIRGLYRDDAICERQRRSLQPVAVPTTSAEPTAWLAAETVKLERLEQQLASRTN